MHKNSCLGGHEFYNFGRLILGHYYYSLSLSDLCLEVETKILKRIMHFYYMTYNYLAIPRYKNSFTGGVMKFTTLVDLSMVIFTMHLVCLNHTPILPPFGVVAMKFLFFSLSSRCYIPNLLKISSIVYERY